jgi:hypothetical protein
MAKSDAHPDVTGVTVVRILKAFCISLAGSSAFFE